MNISNHPAEIRLKDYNKNLKNQGYAENSKMPMLITMKTHRTVTLFVTG